MERKGRGRGNIWGNRRWKIVDRGQKERKKQTKNEVEEKERKGAIKQLKTKERT